MSSGSPHTADSKSASPQPDGRSPSADAVATLRFDPPDLAIITLDDPRKSANVLSRRVLDELERIFVQLADRTDLVGLIIRSGKAGSFIVGADLREFAASLDAPREEIVAMCLHGRRLFERLSQAPFVTVAAIDGICVGGGGELAIWCDRRIMSDDAKAQFGFPEVKLGLFPGWGGTARTARLVGLSNAVELVTSGESIGSKAAAAMGLVSDVAPGDHLLAAAEALVRAEHASRQFERDRQQWRGPIAMDDTELTFLGATASAYIQQQTHGHYPAPLAALETMLEAASSDIEAACQLEAERMSELFGSPINRALINVFFLTDRNKKDLGVDAPPAGAPIEPRSIGSVSVLGAGIMGQGIAAANVKRSIRVTLADASPEALVRGVGQTLEEVAYDKERKAADAQRAVRFAPYLRSTASDAELAASDLVIEAIVENAEIKKSVYARLEPLLSPTAILASNTSTIEIGGLAAGLKRPERFLGIHFFNPVRKMPLVEVIRGPKTSDETVATAVAYAKRLGKSPIVVHDGPGFLVNRLLLPFLNEALELISDGAPIKQIEKASRDFGMPMGPLALYDMVGIDTSFYAGRDVEAFPDRITASPILPALIKAGRLGQKSGAGFFAYKDKKGRGEPDPAADKILGAYVRGSRPFSQEELTHRMFLPMVLEATRILSAKLVRDVRDVDLGVIFGLGFPAFRGGLLFWADTLGAARIVELLAPLATLGERMRPTPMLQEMAKTGRKFYDAARS